MVDKRTKHGLKGTRIECIWQGIKQRCFNPNNHAFKYYGGRGITMCEHWKGSLANFFADMGHPPESYTIDRVDNNKGYEPSNCVWVSRKQQMNNRRCNRIITFKNKTQTAMQWADELNIPHQTIYQRLDLGWDAEKVLFQGKQIDKSGLQKGTQASIAARKARAHCKNGHEFNDAVDAQGNRRCKKCHADRQRNRRHSINSLF